MDRTTPADDVPSEAISGRTTRRGLLTAGARIALAAPALLVAMQAGGAVAFADHDGDGGQPANNNQIGGRASNLCRVKDVDGDDFDKGDAGDDRLSRGAVSAVKQNDGNGNSELRAAVVLVGAEPNQDYRVRFARFNDADRRDLGTITTDGNGDFRGLAPDALGGSSRVGIFVITRGGNDQFVTCFDVHTTSSQNNGNGNDNGNNGWPNNWQNDGEGEDGDEDDQGEDGGHHGHGGGDD